jgi:hypothetical protein
MRKIGKRGANSIRIKDEIKFEIIIYEKYFKKS